MKDFLDGYKVYLNDVKKTSANTLEAYIRDVNQFVTYCANNDIHNIDRVNESTIRKYIDYLDFLGKSEATKTRIVASLRCYFKYLITADVVKHNPTDAIKFKKAEKKLPDVLDANEIVLLLSQPDNRDYKGIRDKAMLELLYATGIKVSELIELSINDINTQVGILHTHGSKNERIIPIYPAAIRHLNDYINSVRPAMVEDDDTDILFTNMNGQPMSRQGFWKIIKHYAEKAGINKDITPHTLRHSFAAHLLENGAQLKDIKEMLGHSDISSTQVYAQLVKSKYVQSYAKFHPLAKK
ncbi:MAG: tyrosine recombinase [Clostridia bacterium]|nr:tyrosine recombinase [Clostridia bacterium]